MRHNVQHNGLLAWTPEEGERFFKFVNKEAPNGCWEWTGCRNTGYGEIATGKGQKVKAHRQSYYWAKGEIPKGLVVMHKCDNPPCVNPNHLEVGTHQDNRKDASRKGRLRGVEPWDTHNTTKLTPEIARIIRTLCAQKWNQRDVAAVFGISQAAISLIVRRKNWAWVI